MGYDEYSNGRIIFIRKAKITDLDQVELPDEFYDSYIKSDFPKLVEDNVIRF